MDESLGLDVPQSGTLANQPLLFVNLPAEFARLRAFLLA
ncbi:threonine synthase [Aeromonas hydrophila]|nr:threonine synthase [Aeromonas hydrophila]